VDGLLRRGIDPRKDFSLLCGGDIRGVQLAGCCEHTAKPGQRLMARATGGSGRDDIRGVQLFKSQGHSVTRTMWAYVNMGRKPMEQMMGLLEGRTKAISEELNPVVNWGGAISGKFKSQSVTNS
jgi:hypothetical protein